MIFHWNKSWRDGYGALYNVFVRDRNSLINWSKANPKSAKIYWEEGFQLLRAKDEGEKYKGQIILWECWRFQEDKDLSFLQARIKEIKEGKW